MLPLSREIHMNRFVGGVHLGGIFLIAVALAAPLRWALSRSNVWYTVAALALVFLVLLPVFGERRSYLAQNALSIDKGRQALTPEDKDLSALYRRLKELPPGRVYAGHARGFVLDHWSDHYLVGDIKVYHLLHGQSLDMVGKVYHIYSLNSDVLINFDEQRWDHHNLYNARYVVAPEGQIFPEFVRLLEQFGRHRLYQVDTTGYFDLVGSDLTFAGETPDLYLAASTWLGSRMPVAKKHPLVSFGDPFQGEAPLTSAIDLIPEMDPPTGPPRGTVMSGDIGGNHFAANVNVERKSMLLLKAMYHPNWRATVDGVKTDTVMLMPSFVGVPLTPGKHQVRIEYRPRRLRMILLGLGLLTLPMIWIVEKKGAAIASRFAPGASVRLSGAFRWPKSPGGRLSRRYGDAADSSVREEQISLRQRRPSGGVRKAC